MAKGLEGEVYEECERIKVLILNDPDTPYMVELQHEQDKKLYTATLSCAASVGSVDDIDLTPDELQCVIDCEAELLE
jgi:hypothetical protein